MFCLLTLQPIDAEDAFYEPGIQRLLEAGPRMRKQEEWMEELCANAVDRDWVDGQSRPSLCPVAMQD